MRLGALYNYRCIFALTGRVDVGRLPVINGALRTTGNDNRSSTQQSDCAALVHPDDHVRIQLQLESARTQREIERLQATYAAEETAQRALEAEFTEVIGQLRSDVDEFTAVVDRLESRLERLEHAGQAMSDDELDDQEFDERVESATFWAEWRNKRDEPRRNAHDVRRPTSRKRVDERVQRLYRKLARLIHPDLVDDPDARASRETAMRLANEAYEAGDAAQLERLMNVWIDAQQDEQSFVPTVSELQDMIEKQQGRLKSLQSQLRELETSETGRLLRMDRRSRNRHLERERERLRRELASLRLRRRRLQRVLDSRREEFTEVSD